MTMEALTNRKPLVSVLMPAYNCEAYVLEVVSSMLSQSFTDFELWHKVSALFCGVESPLQLYFYSRNILLWAERHLPRSAYWPLFRKTLQDALRLSVGTADDGPLLKRWLWGLSSPWRRLHYNGSDASGRARYLGFRDYLLRRFDDCPDEVRKLRVSH